MLLSKSLQLKRLRFVRAIFGVTSTLFLLNVTIKSQIKRLEFDQPFIQKFENYFYVNDFSGGDISFADAFELFKKL